MTVYLSSQRCIRLTTVVAVAASIAVHPFIYSFLSNCTASFQFSSDLAIR